MRTFINMLSTSAVLFAAHKDAGAPGFDAQKEVDIVNKDVDAGDFGAADKELGSLTKEQKAEVIERGLEEALGGASDAAQDGDDDADAERVEDMNENLADIAG